MNTQFNTKKVVKDHSEEGLMIIGRNKNETVKTQYHPID
jgi:hypothetical protein